MKRKIAHVCIIVAMHLSLIYFFFCWSQCLDGDLYELLATPLPERVGSFASILCPCLCRTVLDAE